MPIEHNLQHQVIVVTGAASGIGAAMAAQFAEMGATVFGIDIQSQIRADTLRKYSTTNVHMVVADVTDDNQVRDVFTSLRSECEHIDTLINVVGVYPHNRLKDLEPAEWHYVLDSNLTSTYLCTRHFSLTHAAQKPASIINIASINGLRPEITHSHYGAAKAGVIMLTQTCALDLAPLQIRVNCIAPGLIDTPGLRKYDPERAERFLQRCPLHTLGTYEDVSAAALFLASDSARWITGQIIILDGGVTLAHPY